MRLAPVSLGYSRGRTGRVLAQQSHEPNKQRATDHHRPVPDIQIEKPAIGRYQFELHARPRPKTTPPPISSQCASGLVYYRLQETTDNCQN
jgi:hypothetical protein